MLFTDFDHTAELSFMKSLQQTLFFSSAVLAVPFEGLYILIELNVKDNTFLNISLSIYV